MNRCMIFAPFCITVSDTCPDTSIVKATAAWLKLWESVL